jgi:methionyl-tRNA formyltransferase
MVTAAYGALLPEEALALAPLGSVNLHASLLPRWRGANPVAWAIRRGDRVTGVSLMRMEAGLDTGPVIAMAPVVVRDDDTTGTLTGRLAEAAAALLARAWPSLLGGVPGVPQGTGATRARRFRAEEARLDPGLSADEAWRWWRSMQPQPGPYTTVGGLRIGLQGVRPRDAAVDPGAIRVEGDSWLVGLRSGSLEVSEIRPAGGRAMSPAAFLRGHPGLGRRFDPTEGPRGRLGAPRSAPLTEPTGESR